MFFQFESKCEQECEPEDSCVDTYIEEHNAIREIDEVLRTVCEVEVANPEKGPCCRCPYRDYFFGKGKSEELYSRNDVKQLR